MHVTNNDRAAWAQVAIDAYQDATGTDDESALGDLLCDLRHWAKRADYDFDEYSARGLMHFEAEVEEEEDRRVAVDERSEE